MSTRSVKPDVLRPSILGMQEFMVLQPTAAHGNYPTLTHALILRPGRWLGKAFSSRSSEGYNLFYPGRTAPPSKGSLDKEGFPDGTLRERFFGFSPFVDSVYGSGASSELDYGRGGNNGPLFGGMRDEIRKVNDHLYVGLGYIKAFGGKYCNSPFILEGPPAGKFSHPKNK
eukprot:jgi/Undpi1/11791/HiC_scaffold_4.g01490.m1